MQVKEFFEGKKDDPPFFKKCSRFEPNHQTINHESALTYLKLRDDGCLKSVAQRFCSKTFCRVDSTRSTDGPLGHKILKIKKPRTPSLTINGWTSTQPNYDLGFKYCPSPSEFLESQFEDKFFDRYFRKHEQRIKGDHGTKLLSLKAYFQEINSKCNFTKLSPKQLYEKLKYENDQLQKGTKWKNLEIVTSQNSSHWIDEDLLATPFSINNMFSPPTSSVPNSPFNKPTHTRAASSEPKIEYKIVTSRIDLVGEKAKQLKSIIKPNTSNGSASKSTRVVDTTDYEDTKSYTAHTLSLITPKLLDLNSIHDHSPSPQKEKIPRPHIDENFANYLKIYQELEAQTKLLVEMTNEMPADSPTFKKKKTMFLKSQTSFLENENRRKIKRVVRKDSMLAEEFNRINYFYYSKDEKGEPISPDDLKKQAEQMMKKRKEKRKIDKTIFEAIIQGQSQKDNAQHEHHDSINTRNIEELKNKIIELKKFLSKKVGMDVLGIPGHLAPQENGSNYTTSMTSLPRNSISGSHPTPISQSNHRTHGPETLKVHHGQKTNSLLKPEKKKSSISLNPSNQKPIRVVTIQTPK